MMRLLEDTKLKITANRFLIASLSIILCVVLVVDFSPKSNVQNKKTLAKENKMDKAQIIEMYVNAWNAVNVEERKSLLNQSFAADGNYTDPHAEKPVDNLDGMNELISIFRSRLPHKLIVIGDVEYHNNVFRLKWRLENQQNILSFGTFVGKFQADNKIQDIIAFIDK